MTAPQWILESSSFTSTSALAREIQAWLEFSDAQLEVRVRSDRELEELAGELADAKSLERVKVVNRGEAL